MGENFKKPHVSLLEEMGSPEQDEKSILSRSQKDTEDFETFVDEVFERLIDLKVAQIVKTRQHLYVSGAMVCLCLQFIIVRILM